MAWTAPRTWVASEVVSAAIMNTHVRDDFLETAPAKVTTAGDLVYATGANALARLGIGSTGQVLTVVSGLPAWAGTGTTYKSADQSVNNSVALVNDTHLFFAMAANEIWSFRIYLYGSQSSTGNAGFRFNFTVPAGATGQANFERWYDAGFGGDPTILTASTANNYITQSSSIPAASDFSISTTVQIWYFRFEGIVINGATPGNLQLKWAQSNAVAQNATLKKASYLSPTRLA